MRLDKKDKAQALIKEIRTFNTASPFKSLTLVYQLLIDKNDEAALIQLDTVLANAPFHSDALKYHCTVYITKIRRWSIRGISGVLPG